MGTLPPEPSDLQKDYAQLYRRLPKTQSIGRRAHGVHYYSKLLAFFFFPLHALAGTSAFLLP